MSAGIVGRFVKEIFATKNVIEHMKTIEEIEKELKRNLEISEIDFRIQSINKGKYAMILAYKNARVDMDRLDSAVGSLFWKREHSRENKNCNVLIYNPEIKEWVGKEDTGVESFSAKEKGLASDSFKRSCFNWGIGRELYDYPKIIVKLLDSEVMEVDGKFKQSYNLKINEWKWHSIFESGKLVFLGAKDNDEILRFKLDVRKNDSKTD